MQFKLRTLLMSMAGIPIVLVLGPALLNWAVGLPARPYEIGSGENKRVSRAAMDWLWPFNYGCRKSHAIFSGLRFNRYRSSFQCFLYLFEPNIRLEWAVTDKVEAR